MHGNKHTRHKPSDVSAETVEGTRKRKPPECSPVECKAWYQLEEGHESCVLLHESRQQQRTQQTSGQDVHVAECLGAGRGWDVKGTCHLERQEVRGIQS